MRKYLIPSLILNVLLIGFLCMWFDDEIGRFFKKNISDRFEESTMSPNVRIFEDAITITPLNRKRSLRIYTPPNYESRTDSFPVIYSFDGDNLFDQRTTGRDEWHADEIMDAKAKAGKQEVIIVGIDATEFRSTEMNPYDPRNAEKNESDLFLNYIVDELKPYIDKTYRTLPTREHTGIMGASLGGLMAFYGIMKYPETFSKAGALSPSFLHNADVYDLPQQLTNRDVKIYMNTGKNEFVGMITVMELMEKTLLQEGFTPDQVRTKIVEGGHHDPITWEDGIRSFYEFAFEE